MITQTQSTTIIKSIKKPLIVFSGLFLLTYFYSLESAFIMTSAFMVYISLSSVTGFFRESFMPQIIEGDTYSYQDMPVIPNQQEMLDFMWRADHAYNNDLTHLPEDVLSRWNLDRFGNRLD